MKINKLKLQNEFIYPATIADAVKDANFTKDDSSIMTQGEINLYLNNKIDSSSYLSKTEADQRYVRVIDSPDVEQKVYSSSQVDSLIDKIKTVLTSLGATQEQINSLCALYDKQIEKLKKSNEIRKQKLLEYRKKLQIEN